MNDPLERIIRPIVEGQIRSFLHDHPEIAAAWTAKHPQTTKAEAIKDSLAKRISRDLLCSHTRVRLISALAGMTTGSVEDDGLQDASGSSGAGLEVCFGSAPTISADAQRGLDEAWGAVDACGGIYPPDDHANGYAAAHGGALDAACAAIEKLGGRPS